MTSPYFSSNVHSKSKMANAIVYTCDQCGLWIKNDHVSILHHYNTEHKREGKGTFICPICWKSFSRKWTTIRHINSKHVGVCVDPSIVAPTFAPHSDKIPSGKTYWPIDYHPTIITFNVIYANGSPYPSTQVLSMRHPPRRFLLSHL